MISRKEFLASVLPSLQDNEQYCVLGIKTIKDKDSIRQLFVDSIDSLSDMSDKLVSQRFNVFFSLASYSKNLNKRISKNAINLKSFFIDLDCGLGKPFKDLPEGLIALKKFTKETGLPVPTIIKSGRGAHIYWTLEEPIDKDKWKQHADKLKRLCVQYDFSVDANVTGDISRILRVPETLHLKDPRNPIPVEILKIGKLIPIKLIEQILTPIDPVIKSQFQNKGDDYPKCSFKQIEDRTEAGEGCAQIKYILDNVSTLDEPTWRAGLSIAQCCEDREYAIIRISDKHPDYNYASTDRKASATVGPLSCNKLGDLAPDRCLGCKYKGNFTSPISLGKIKQEVQIKEEGESICAVMDTDSTTKEYKQYIIPKFPKPFRRGPNGGVYIEAKNEEQDGKILENELVYPHDFYVVKRMHDPDYGEMMLLRLHLPMDGVRDFTIPLSTVMAKDRFVSAISSFGVTSLGKKQDIMLYYVARSIEDLQTAGKAEKSHKQFGWTEQEDAIILGESEIRANEILYSPPSVPTIPLIPMFKQKGSFDEWKNTINAYSRPGMEPRAFAFFMGFGTLLMRFTSLDGFLLNLYSRESGSGKTTILHAINSIYGRPKELLLSPKDTYNSRINRLGVMQNFATTLDEITNMPPDQMSNQVYDVTTGKGKNRLRQHDNAERQNNTKWQTGMISSSNRTVTDSLLSIKGFPDGELKRILEINIKPDPFDDATWARKHFSRLMDNYGHAGPKFCQYLVANKDEAKDLLFQTQEFIETQASINNAERYWALMVSLAMTGGILARKLDLHNINVKPVLAYAINLIKETRLRTNDYLFEVDDFLGGFLQRHFNEILVINGGKKEGSSILNGPIKEPRGSMTARYEPDTKLLYVVLRNYREDCAKLMMNFEETIAPYRKSGALLEHIKRKHMTYGTAASMEAAVSVLCFDATRLDNFDEGVLLSAKSPEHTDID